MTYRTIRLEITDEVAVVILNRPEVRNAFGDGMGEELADEFRQCDSDDDVRVVVRRGFNDGTSSLSTSVSVGLDRSEMSSQP